MVLVALSATTSADAQDWYPIECGSKMYCAPVESSAYDRVLDEDNNPRLLAVTTKHGTTLVPENFASRHSPDNKIHACMKPVRAEMSLVCLFVPGVLR